MAWSLNFAEDEDSQYWTKACDVCHDDSEELHVYKDMELCCSCYAEIVKDREWSQLPVASDDECERCFTAPLATRILKGLCTCHQCAKEVWSEEWDDLPKVYNTYSKTDPYLNEGDS